MIATAKNIFFIRPSSVQEFDNRDFTNLSALLSIVNRILSLILLGFSTIGGKLDDRRGIWRSNKRTRKTNNFYQEKLADISKLDRSFIYL
jgi:hypothetical protein